MHTIEQIITLCRAIDVAECDDRDPSTLVAVHYEPTRRCHWVVRLWGSENFEDCATDLHTAVEYAYRLAEDRARHVLARPSPDAPTGALEALAAMVTP